MKKTSEFGKGFIYNLFLFAKHFYKLQIQLELWEKMHLKNPGLFTEADAISMWFNGAGDHFFDLTVPPMYKATKIGRLARKLQTKALTWRMNEMGGKEEFDKFFDDLERLTRMIDEDLGVRDIKATWN